MRYVKGDDIWLSPNYHRNSCHITILIYNPSPAAKKHYFHSIYNATLQFSPRVHWAKYLCDITSHDLMSMYPRFSDFARIREKTDPHNIFINDALRQTFGFD